MRRVASQEPGSRNFVPCVRGSDGIVQHGGQHAATPGFYIGVGAISALLGSALV
jgi:hypothetical protein